jgi:outer membrane receptor protein involved in Fe transport
LFLKSILLAGVAATLACPALAQQAAQDESGQRIVVIAAAPLDPGTQAEFVPAAISQLDADDLTRTGTADVLGALNRQLGGITLDEAQANPFQPNLLYRGFEASPLPGNAQGLAVYVDGTRFNQAFGDTVDWDLIPDMAVSSVDIVSSNPAFGLNALGGALGVHLKNGFDNAGATLEASGGSFGRGRLAAEYGVAENGVALYVAATGLDDDGWRAFSPSRLRQAYSDIGWRDGDNEVHATFQAADNKLTGNGSSPVELLAYDRNAVFTHPDTTENKYGRFALTGDFRLDSWRLNAQAYGARLDRHTVNGDAAEVQPCDDDDDILCSSEEDDLELTDINGGQVDNFIANSPYADDFPEFDEGGPYAFLNQTATATSSYGASAQASIAGNLGGLTNRFSMGASFDGSKTRFHAGTTVGGLSLDRGWFSPGVEIDTPDANITPVSVRVTTEYYGLFLSDALDLTPRLTATLTARANEANVVLEDQLGTALNGDHTFRRINPALGLTWRPNQILTVYGGYSESSRAPTAAELSCADETAPCSLTNFFVADPPLNQVVGRTFELGVRGHMDMSALSLAWHAGAYRTDLSDDIQFVASTTAGRGFFTNVGKTRRQGVELGVSGEFAGLEAYADYAWTDATYRTAFDLFAGANPAFDDEDDIMTVERGDRRPGIPEHSLKAGVDWRPTEAWTVGADGVYSSGRYLVGDEANVAGKTDSYFLANAHIKWRIHPGVEFFAEIENLFDEEYESFGAFSPVESVPIIGLGELSDPRSLSPGTPRAGFAGVRLRF